MPIREPEGARRALLERLMLFRDALIGSLVIAITCSILGVYVVLRRIVFESGPPAERRALFFTTGQTQRSHLAETLGPRSSSFRRLVREVHGLAPVSGEVEHE